MDHSELIKRIKEYESKWGQLGHTNIMKPEKTTISHSGTETNGGKDKMTDMKNDFLEFRKKVYNGNKANKIAHTSTVNVKDLNERYFEEVTSNGTLIHAQSPLYGEQRENTKYYKREGEPGKYKYYYTKEEWDAAHNKSDNSKEEESGGKVAGTIDPRDGKMIKYTENGPVKMNTTFEQYRQGAQMEADRKIERTAKESGLSAGVKTLLKDERMSEMFDQFEGGFENHGWTLNYDGTISGMTEEDENYVKSVQDWAKKFKDSTGVDLYGSKEFQDAVTKEIQNRWEKVNGSKEKSPKATDTTKKDAVEAESVSKKQEVKDNSETVKKEGPIKKRTKDGEEIKSTEIKDDEEIKSTETKDVKTDNAEVKTTKEKEVKAKDPETRSKEISNRLADLGKGGNVDLNNLPDVPTKFLKKAGYDEIDEGETVKTYTSTFTSDEDGSCYNFSPIMVDPKTGKFLGVMPADEFDEYCLDVVNGKRKDDHNLQIGGKFTGKDAESKAAAACQEIDKLHAESDKLNKKSDKDNSKKTSSNPKTDKTVKMYTDKVKNESPKKVAKEIIKNRDFGIDELYHEVKEAIKDGAMIWDGSDLVAVSSSKGDKKKYNKANEYVNEIYRDMAKYIDAIAEDSGKGAELWKEIRTTMGDKFDRLSKKYAPSNKEAKHSAIEEEDMNINKVQSTVNGEEILDEYRAFKERANRGARMNQLSHSAIISPEELNARYEEEIRNNSIIVHAGKANKYYQKPNDSDDTEKEVTNDEKDDMD